MSTEALLAVTEILCKAPCDGEAVLGDRVRRTKGGELRRRAGEGIKTDSNTWIG